MQLWRTRGPCWFATRTDNREKPAKQLSQGAHLPLHLEDSWEQCFCPVINNMWFCLQEPLKTEMSEPEVTRDLHDSLKTTERNGHFSQTCGDHESYHPSQKIQKAINKWKKAVKIRWDNVHALRHTHSQMFLMLAECQAQRIKSRT